MNPNDFLRSNKEVIAQIAKRHGVTRIRVFGSVARGEAHETSDFDFLVAFEPSRSLFDLIALKQDLEVCLGRKVDIVSEGGVSPYLRNRIFKEAVPL